MSPHQAPVIHFDHPEEGRKVRIGACMRDKHDLANPQMAHDAWTLRRAHDLDFNQGAAGNEPPHGAKTSFFQDGDQTDNAEDDNHENEEEDDESGEETDKLQQEIDKLESEIAELEEELKKT